MSETYTLYWSTRTSALIPDAAIAEIGADIERIRVQQTNKRVDDPVYEAISPMKQIPALVLPDGTVLLESLAIALAIVERHQDAGLLPPVGSSARAEAYRWLMHIICNIYEVDLRHSYPDRYTSDPEGIEGVKRAAEERWDRAFQVVEDALGGGPSMLESGFSLVDVYLAACVCWHYDPPALIARSPKIARVCANVRKRDKIGPLFERYEMPELNGLG